MAQCRVTVKGRMINNATFNPKTNEYGKEQYSALVILDNGEEEKIKEAKSLACKEEFGGKIPANLQDWTVREGDDEDYDLTFGKRFINAKATKKPKALVRRNGELEQIGEDDGLIYAGVNVAVSVDIYAYKKNVDKKIPAGVSCGLRAVMFRSHNDPLSSNIINDDEFDGIESDDDLEL